MKKICAFLLLSACTTTPPSPPSTVKPQDFPRVTVIGKETAQIKSPALADPTAEDWKQTQASCVTHLYQCQYDDKGQVKQIKSLDRSETTFQAFTEEALRSWSFAPGKSGECYAQMIYERDLPTRVLVIPADVAQSMVSQLEKNRAARPKLEANKPTPTLLRRTKLEMPREMAFQGQSGYIVINYEIDPDGVPTNIQVVEDEPEGALEKNAIKAIQQWRYAKLADEPQSSRQTTTTFSVVVQDGQPLSVCDLGLKPNRLARAQLPLQENTTGPRQAPNPSLK